MKISEIHLNPDNPRFIKDDRFEKLINNIKEFPKMMKLRPIIIDDSGKILGGNMRYRALIELGYQEIPEGWVVKASELTEEEKERFIITDNIPYGDWDNDKLANEWDEIKLEDWGMDLSEINIHFEIEAEEDDFDVDKAVEDTKEPICKLGDIWQLGNHRIMCGDSTKKEDVEKLMNGKKADMVFTDPPYSVNYEKKTKEIFKDKSYNKITNDEMDIKEISEFIWKPSFKNMYEVSKDDCSFYMTMPQGGDQMMMMMSQNWLVKHELIWVKNNPVFSMGRLDYDYQHEPIMYGWKKNHKFYGKGQFKKSIWEIVRDKGKLHPTMKPLELISNCLLNSSQEKQIILDLFLGSGSTLIACEQLNRTCYGMEIDPIYCDVVIRRWEEYTKEKAVKLNV